jgi:uncharacterized Zn-binding protein involved in type VI secretion
MNSTKRRATMLGLALVAFWAAGFAASDAQNARGGPVVGGSPDVSVGGYSAARQGDAIAGGGGAAEGSANVFIDGKPAATTGARTACGGVIATGSPTVFINGKPLARRGDATSGCARP